ncbi:MAG: tetratricopeptide repeat protein [Methylococcaceae bacterium]
MTQLIIQFSSASQFTVSLNNDTATPPLEFISPFSIKNFDDLRWYLENYASGYISEVDDNHADTIAGQLKPLGEALFKALFTEPQAHNIYNDFYREDDRRLIISAKDTEILSLPWELLCEPNGSYLLHDNISLQRRYNAANTGRTPFKINAKEKLHLLFIVSRPKQAGFLNPRAEAQAIIQAINTAQANISYEFLRPATLNNLMARLNDEDLPKIDMIHFDGHGVFNDNVDNDNAGKQENNLTKASTLKSNVGYLLFETKEGDNDLISAETIADALYHKQIPLLVLSACQSAMVGNKDALNSVAARLIHAGIPSVVAMSYSVLVQTTELLFAQFYLHLAKGKSINTALDKAKSHLLFNPKRGERKRGTQLMPLELNDWFVPALYQSQTDAVLLKKTDNDDNTIAIKTHNLPQLQEVGFFGRSHELWQIERYFVQGTRRITITGFGGQGKTYLAIEAGLWLLNSHYIERVCFIDYASFQGVDALGSARNALADVFNESLVDNNAVTAQLKKHATLIILDNLESLNNELLQPLLTQMAQWSDIVKTRVLLTTRTAQFAHSSYSQASIKHRYLALTGLNEPDALAFYQALQKLPPEPKFKTVEPEVLLNLFAQVEFHPLSIAILSRELKFRRPAQLGERLQYLLTVVPANSENKSLIASLNLSLERLNTGQRELIKNLGVFQGGAFENNLLAVTQITANDWQDLRPALYSIGLITIEDLNYLNINVSYIKFHPSLAPALWQELNNEQQQRLLSCFRQRYYAVATYLYNEDRKNPHTIRAIAQRELANLLYAVYSAIEYQESFSVDFSDSINKFLKNFGLKRDSQALIKTIQGLNFNSERDNYLVRSNHGEQLFNTGQYQKAQAVFTELYQSLVNTGSYELCATLGRLARCFGFQGKTKEAITYYQQALQTAQALTPSLSVQKQISSIYTDLANSFIANGDFKQAQFYYQQSLVIDKEIGDTRGMAIVYGQLGMLALLQGDLIQAEQYYQTALSDFKALNEPQMEAIAWHQLGYVYQEAKNYSKAEDAYRNSAQIKENLGNLTGAASTWNNLAIVTAAQGKIDSAEAWYRKAIAVYETANPKELAACLNNLANLLQHQTERLNEALSLAEQALSICKTLDEASSEIWTTYNVLTKIADKQHDNKARDYRQLARESYCRFAGMPYQIKPWVWLIIEVYNALISESIDEELHNDLEQLKQKGWINLVVALEKLLQGEREPSILMESLNFQEAAIIHIILTALKQPESLQVFLNTISDGGQALPD